ncbi:MAG: calcium/sodium antiporter [Nanoarchaeota archaeon]|nr:calcium/sodium antiporter [Nanoarchaeota archaeon]MBU1051349.1 calcium/sodium antiporter [Nanoarchaeota archaeon]MBU1988610.1 calcium/sodium antiporter [Nanoarchaeota archaeon]
MITNFLILIGGLILLVKGSDYFVKSAASISKRFGVSEFVIGLTLVAFGTSIPELASSVAASLNRSSGLIIGNVVGSNIANIGLIIGITSLVAVIKTNKGMLKRDGYIMVFVALIFLIFSLNGTISRLESGVLLLLYVAYTLFLFEMKPELEGKYNFKEFFEYLYKFQYVTTIRKKALSGFSKNKKKEMVGVAKVGLFKDFVVLIFGGIAIVFGAKYLVGQAVYFADIFNLPQTLVGISLIAIGTSLPELSVSISAARKGFANIAIGNIIGSNIANVLLVAGISGIIFPLEVLRSTVYYIIPFMIFMSVLLLAFLRTRWKITKIEGAILLLLYVVFMVLLVTQFIS